MKRNDSLPLGSNYGATVRLLGPHVPDPVLHPLEELEPIRNPFLPPEAAPREPVDAEFETSSPASSEGNFERESDVWSHDTAPRRVPENPPSGRIIFSSFLVFAALGAGGFAALYTAVHSNDATNREHYAAEESRGMPAPAVTAGIAAPIEGANATAAAPTTGSDSGAPAANTAAMTAPAPTDAHRPVAVLPAIVPVARVDRAPAWVDSAPARKSPVVVHIEPSPVPLVHRPMEDKDVPVSEDAVLADPAQKAAESAQKPQAAAVQPSNAGDDSAPSHADPSLGGATPPSAGGAAATANAAVPEEPPPSSQNPDDRRK